MTATYFINSAALPSDLAINLGSFAVMRSPSLSCAHWNSCVLAFWLLMFELNLNASHLRMKASHVSLLIPFGPLLAESVKVHLALLHFLMNRNSFHGQLYVVPEACKLTHMIHLVFCSSILELGGLFNHNKIFSWIMTPCKINEFNNNENICKKTSINI